MLAVYCCSLVVDCSRLFVVRCPLCVVCWLFVVGGSASFAVVVFCSAFQFVARHVLIVVCCLWFVVCSLVLVGCCCLCRLFVACCVLLVGLCVVCGSLFGLHMLLVVVSNVLFVVLCFVWNVVYCLSFVVS